jgi:hypothetical protein
MKGGHNPHVLPDNKIKKLKKKKKKKKKKNLFSLFLFGKENLLGTHIKCNKILFGLDGLPSYFGKA